MSSFSVGCPKFKCSLATADLVSLVTLAGQFGKLTSWTGCAGRSSLSKLFEFGHAVLPDVVEVLVEDAP